MTASRSTSGRYPAPIAVTLLLAGLSYLLLEAIATLGFTPTYNYARWFISDLGIPYKGDSPTGLPDDSSLAAVMNAGFMIHGALFALAGTLAFRAAPVGRARVAVLALSYLHAIGIWMVAIWHGGTREEANGDIVFHGTGALLAILCGNVLIVLIGVLAKRYGAPRGYSIFCVAAGVIGLIAFTLLAAVPSIFGVYPGVPERISVYSIMLWDFVTAVVILVAKRRASSFSADGVGPARV